MENTTKGIDLEKLTTAPWEARFDGAMYYVPGVITGTQKEVDAKFVALARNAFDVMMQRGWGVVMQETSWLVVYPGPMPTIMPPFFSDHPFVALVEADKWYKENVEEKCTS